jgi:hypothetical protein
MAFFHWVVRIYELSYILQLVSAMNSLNEELAINKRLLLSGEDIFSGILDFKGISI